MFTKYRDQESEGSSTMPQIDTYQTDVKMNLSNKKKV